MNEVTKKLSDAYDELQTLNVQATKRNMEVILFTLSTLKEAYNFINSNCDQKMKSETTAEDSDHVKPTTKKE